MHFCWGELFKDTEPSMDFVELAETQ